MKTAGILDVSVRVSARRSRYPVSTNRRYVVFRSECIAVEPARLDGSACRMQISIARLPSMSIEPVSEACDGTDAHGATPAVSADGRHVAFMSQDDLGREGLRSRRPNIYLRDTKAGTTVRVSRGAHGEDANGASSWPSISADGRFVAFTSDASNLVKGDDNKEPDVFLYDALTRATELVSKGPMASPARVRAVTQSFPATDRSSCFSRSPRICYASGTARRAIATSIWLGMSSCGSAGRAPWSVQAAIEPQDGRKAAVVRQWTPPDVC